MYIYFVPPVSLPSSDVSDFFSSAVLSSERGICSCGDGDEGVVGIPGYDVGFASCVPTGGVGIFGGETCIPEELPCLDPAPLSSAVCSAIDDIAGDTAHVSLGEVAPSPPQVALGSASELVSEPRQVYLFWAGDVSDLKLPMAAGSGR